VCLGPGYGPATSGGRPLRGGNGPAQVSLRRDEKPGGRLPGPRSPIPSPPLPCHEGQYSCRRRARAGATARPEPGRVTWGPECGEPARPGPVAAGGPRVGPERGLAGAVRAVRPVTSAEWRGCWPSEARPRRGVGERPLGRGREPERLAGPTGRPESRIVYLDGQYWEGQG
jgi:hypothetical protein